MTVAQRIISAPEADAGFGLLKDIVEMVKNPKAIAEAYEVRRKAAELSDDEVAKSVEARALIAKAEDLQKSLKKREDALIAAKVEHQSAIASHKLHVQTEQENLDKVGQILTDVARQQEEEFKRLTEEKESILSDSLKTKKDIDNRLDSLNARENNLEAAEKANQEKSKKLEELESKLKIKASNLAAIAAS